MVVMGQSAGLCVGAAGGGGQLKLFLANEGSDYTKIA